MLYLEFQLCILLKDPRTVISGFKPLEKSHFYIIDGQQQEFLRFIVNEA
jgi:hypothetical protein